MPRLLAWGLERITVLSGRGKIRGGGDEVRSGHGGMRGLWQEIWEAAGEVSPVGLRGEAGLHRDLGGSCGPGVEGWRMSRQRRVEKPSFPW